MRDVSIAVIIPTFARPAILRLVLEGLCGQGEAASLAEVIVVCDGGDAATRAVAEAFLERLPLRYMEQPKRGVSAARNVGVAAAQSPVVLLLDDDVVPGPALVEEHARFHREHTEAEAVLLGYVTWHESLPVSPFMRWYGEYGALFGYGLLDDGAVVDARYFYSCNVSLKREFLLAVGGFDERLTVMEDNELGFRLAAGGMRMVHRKAALGFHYQTFTFQQACARLERYSGGLRAYLGTAAGRALAMKRRGVVFRVAERMVRLVGPLLGPLRGVVDGEVRLPRAVYRAMYWYYGSYRSFWSRADGE